jgi:hypothetical protein
VRGDVAPATLNDQTEGPESGHMFTLDCDCPRVPPILLPAVESVKVAAGGGAQRPRQGDTHGEACVILPDAAPTLYVPVRLQPVPGR